MFIQKDPQPSLRIGLARRGVENRLESSLHCGLMHEKEQILLAGEVVIDAGLGEPKPLGKERHRRVVVAAVEKKPKRNFNHFLDAADLLGLCWHVEKSLPSNGRARRPPRTRASLFTYRPVGLYIDPDGWPCPVARSASCAGMPVCDA